MILNNGILFFGDCVFLEKAFIEIIEEIEGKDWCGFHTLAEIHKSPAKKIRLKGVFVFKDACEITEKEFFLLRDISKKMPSVFFVFFTNRNIELYGKGVQVLSNATIFSLKLPLDEVKEHLRLRLGAGKVFLDADNVFNKISKRQIEILSLRLSGLSFKGISMVLGISYKTVMSHRITMARGLGVSRLHDFNYLLKVIDIVNDVEFEKIIGRINLIRSQYTENHDNKNFESDIKLVAPTSTKKSTHPKNITITRLYSVCAASKKKEKTKLASRPDHGTDFSR